MTRNQPAPPAGAVLTLSERSKGGQGPLHRHAARRTIVGHFPVQGSGVSAATAVTLLAQYNGGTASAGLVVAPGDKVSITQAADSQSTHVLNVSATGSNPQAVLNVFLSSNNQLLGTMVNQGGGSYTLQVVLQATPASVSVVSNLGAKTGQGVTVTP
jgi:hypothetical protein